MTSTPGSQSPIGLDFSSGPGIFLALVHHPVLNRRGEKVTSAITNVDLHDLARSGRTFGIRNVFVVSPVTLQQRMVGEVLYHWTQGEGSGHERRADAMRRVTAVASLADAVTAIAARTGRAPVVAVTGAQMREPNATFASLREQVMAMGGVRLAGSEDRLAGSDRLADPDDNAEVRPLLVVFGTGWGLAPEVIDSADLRLPPLLRDPRVVDAEGEYNHLSVRAAVAIALDRLLGESRQVT